VVVLAEFNVQHYTPMIEFVYSLKPIHKESALLD